VFIATGGGFLLVIITAAVIWVRQCKKKKAELHEYEENAPLIPVRCIDQLE
jgi:hypothetical protein